MCLYVVRASSRRGAQRPASVVACERAGRAVPARRTGQGLTARELDRPCALNSRGLVVPTFAVGVAGAFLQIAGANWDVSSHVLGIVDTFFTPPHLVLYVGILLALVAGILGVLIIRPRGEDEQLGLGFRVSLAGSTIQLVAAPLDFWWHSAFGFDPFLFTPTHSM